MWPLLLWMSTISLTVQQKGSASGYFNHIARIVEQRDMRLEIRLGEALEPVAGQPSA
jgi:hypothetical protein